MHNKQQRAYGAHPASFRDPDGYVFEENGTFYRRVMPSYADTYALLMEGGCYKECVEKGLLVPHEDVSSRYAPLEGERVLLPEQIPCVTYPYEWSFSQWRAAALCTLDVLRVALDHGLTLKDASAFNVTWHEGRMIFLDTLSFTPYQEGQPWAGYRQFCSHFLAPLALMRYTDVRCNALFLRYLDGIPLDLAAKLLPWRTKLFPSLGLHIHAHAALQRGKADSGKKLRVTVSRKTITNLTDSLRHAVAALMPPKVKTEWGDYYNDTNYSEDQVEQKRAIIDSWLQRIAPARVLDLGSNDGSYSRLAARHARQVLSLDIDPVAVDTNARRCIEERNTSILPILADITAPSPAVGWNTKERTSIFDRMPCDCAMALALVHHLAIGNNVPFSNIFEVLQRLAPVWILEYVDKEDSQVQRLLRNRPDIFQNYTREEFERAALECFAVEEVQAIVGSQRALYLLRSRIGEKAC